MSKIELMQGDCLEVMKDIPDGSIDAVICDPPYGTISCKWDSIIPFDAMWKQLKRVIKPKGAIVLFGSQPFTATLIASNIKNYRYDWIWVKNRATGHLLANKRPLNNIELISVFSNGVGTYNPQKTKGEPYVKGRQGTSSIYLETPRTGTVNTGDRFPQRTLDFKVDSQVSSLHTSQKPVALMEYLIKTYTNENETVLDFAMGSGTTMLACKNLNRNGIGIELDEEYFKIAEKRINGNL